MIPRKKNSDAKKESSQLQAHGCEYFKVICLILNDDSIQTFVRHYGCNTEYLEKSMIDCKQITTGKSVLDVVKSCGTRRNINEFFNMIATNFEFIKSSETDHLKEISAMKELYDWLEKGYISILPMRSIGPLQWTNSKLDKHEHRDANQSAEILLHLLGNKKLIKKRRKNCIDILYILTNS